MREASILLIVRHTQESESDKRCGRKGTEYRIFSHKRDLHVHSRCNEYAVWYQQYHVIDDETELCGEREEVACRQDGGLFRHTSGILEK